MAYSKEDFVDFSNLDLDELLGDFTASEYELSDSDSGQENSKPKNNTKKGNKSKQNAKNSTKSGHKKYKCDECGNSYASVSGIRGHMRSKHGKNNVKASQYRKASTSSTKREPFKLDQQQFHELFQKTLPESLSNVTSNKFLNMKRSASGKGITDLAKHVLQTDTVLDKLTCELQPTYYNVFNTAAEADINTNETLLHKYHESVYKDNDQVTKLVNEGLDDCAAVPVRQFVAVLHRQLLSDLIANRAKVYECLKTDKEVKLDDTEQSVLFYIAGYILSKLLKHTSGEENKVVSTFLKNVSDSERTFVSKYSEWTKAVSRGGLKVPHDNFFLLIRECEICIRKNYGNVCATQSTYVEAKEILMDDHMVKYYSEKILCGASAPHVIEKCVAIFLNVRGPAVAYKLKNEILTEKDSAQSLRKTLQNKVIN